MVNKKKDKFEFIQKNYTWIFASITGISIVVSYIFRFIEYIAGSFYFSYYGLDMNLYKYNDTGFLYGLCLSTIFVFALLSLVYCFRQFYIGFKNMENKFFCIIENVTIIILSNLYLLIISKIKLDWKYILIGFIILVILEIVMSFLYFKKINGKDLKESNIKYEFANYLKRLPFLIIIFLFLVGTNTIINIKYDKNYKVIDNNKVIVYSNNEYYLTLDCEVGKDKIIIYKGTQEKISNNNIYSLLENYKIVELK